MSTEQEPTDYKIIRFRSKKEISPPEIVRRQFEILSGALDLERDFEKVSWDYWLAFEYNREYKKAGSKAMNRMELEALIKHTIFNSFLLLSRFGYKNEALTLINQDKNE